MCLIAWNWQPGSATPLLLLGNRDEFYARPAAPLQPWADAPILAGRDLQAGGTWLGVARGPTGMRLAALTNYRSATPPRSDAPSRGDLVAGFLRSPQSAEAYLQSLQAQAGAYNPFNLLVFDGQTLLGLESRGARIVRMEPGLGAVSNADFHTPWPKLRQLRNGLEEQLARGEMEDEHLWSLLQSRRVATDAALPKTGVPLELERALSAVFIATPNYGTRASSVVRLTTHTATFSERRYGAEGFRNESSHTFGPT